MMHDDRGRMASRRSMMMDREKESNHCSIYVQYRSGGRRGEMESRGMSFWRLVSLGHPGP